MLCAHEHVMVAGQPARASGSMDIIIILELKSSTAPQREFGIGILLVGE